MDEHTSDVRAWLHSVAGSGTMQPLTISAVVDRIVELEKAVMTSGDPRVQAAQRILGLAFTTLGADKTRLQRVNAELERVNAQLVEALDRIWQWSGHTHSCSVLVGGPGFIKCDCGLSEVIDPAELALAAAKEVAGG